jgi:hypothetical protein
VLVTAYDPSGAAQGTATTDGSGNYNLAAGGSGPYRVEFTNLPGGYFPSAHSADSVNGGAANQAGSAVQFTQDSNTKGVNLAVSYPGDYCQNNPEVCVNQYINGLAAQMTPGEPGTTIWRIPYFTPQGNANNQQPVANKQQVGATWGLAYSKKSKHIYSAAFLKRHVGLKKEPGSIFVSAPGSENGSLFFDLPAGTAPARDLGAAAAPSKDPDAYKLIGKTGLGDIDFSEDESVLYAVNLQDKNLYAIPVDVNNPTAGPPLANMQKVLIPDPGCLEGQWRPFALGVRRGTVYVGGVCDGSSVTTNAFLRGIVYKVNVNTIFSSSTFTTVLDFKLDYPKGTPWAGCPGGWFPWRDTAPAKCATAPSYTILPQPILADLAFDNDGSMIIGFIDRLGHQLGANNLSPDGLTSHYNMVGGDILRANKDASGNFVLENAGIAGSATGLPNGQGPGGGEVYHGDFYANYHQENSEGGLAMLPGSNNIALTFMDPVTVNTSGLAWLNNVNGTKSKGYGVHNGSTTPFFGKANGVGDVEILCDLAPIEIGNRVWKDNDADGIQDAGEPGIANVTVGLYDSGGALIKKAVTDAGGEYYFSSATATDTANAKYGLIIQPNKNYELRVDMSSASLSGLVMTTTDASSNSADSIDSDVTNPMNPNVKFTTGGPGTNDHTFDAGFRPENVTPQEPVKSCCGTGKNFVENGSFDPAKKLVFDSKYDKDFKIFSPGDYLVGDSGAASKQCDNWSILGHTNCKEDDNFLMINGKTSQTTGNKLAWSQNVEVEKSEKEEIYQFCAWFKDLKQCCFNQKPKITLQADVNGTTVTQAATISAGSGKCDWQLVSTEVKVPPGVTSVNLQILLDENANGDGNDVAIDDISLAKFSGTILTPDNTQFTFSNPVFTDPLHYKLTVTPVAAQKPDCKYIWSAVELDSSYNPIPATKRTWNVPPTGAINFPGFPGTTGTLPGIFEVGKTYEFTYRIECDCTKPQTTPQRYWVGFPFSKVLPGSVVPQDLIRIEQVPEGTKNTSTGG